MKRHENPVVSRRIDLEESDWQLIQEMFLPQRLRPGTVVRQIVHRQCNHWRSKLEQSRDGAGGVGPRGGPETKTLDAKLEEIFSGANLDDR